jgi:hypothetical protein
MPTRRNVLKSAAVLSATPLAPTLLYGAGPEAAAHIEVLSDIRHPEARAFNRRAAHLNAPIHPLRDGDITEIWQNYFSVAWKDKPRALVGLTERPALFMLESLSWEHGMRVFFHAEHEPTSAASLSARHTVLRSSRPGLEGHLEAAGAAWPVTLADQLLTAPQAVASKVLTPTGAAMAASLDEPTKLYSWIIAPKSVAQHI